MDVNHQILTDRRISYLKNEYLTSVVGSEYTNMRLIISQIGINHFFSSQKKRKMKLLIAAKTEHIKEPPCIVAKAVGRYFLSSARTEIIEK